MFKKRRGRHSFGAREELCLLPASSGVRGIFFYNILFYSFFEKKKKKKK